MAESSPEEVPNSKFLLEAIQNLIKFYELENLFEKELLRNYLDQLEHRGHANPITFTSKDKIIVSNQLKAGSYIARLTIEEPFSSTYKETSFDIVDPPLRAEILGGTVRNVSSQNSFIPLIAEVRSSSPEYNLRWKCSTPADNGSCFLWPEEAWSRFEKSTVKSVLNPFDLALTRLRGLNKDDFDEIFNAGNGSKIDALKSLFSNLSSGLDDVGNLFKILGNDSERESFIQYFTDDESDIKDSYSFWNVFLLLLGSFPYDDLNGDSTTFTETVTIPLAALRSNITVFRFNVMAQTDKEIASSDQTIILSKYTEDNLGILQPIASQIPFGATKRAVFESDCRTCSENDLKNLEYEWQLGEIIQDVVEEKQVEQMETEDYSEMQSRSGFKYSKEVPNHSEYYGDDKGRKEYFYYFLNEKIKSLLGCYGNNCALNPYIDYENLNLGRNGVLNIRNSALRAFESSMESCANLEDCLELYGNVLLRKLLEKGSKLETEEGDQIKLSLSLQHNFRFGSLNTNSVEKGRESLLCAIPFISILSYYMTFISRAKFSFPSYESSVYLESPLSSQSSFLPPEWEIWATNGVKEVLNASVCSQLVLVVRELFNAGIKFTRERTRRSEGEVERFHSENSLSLRMSAKKRFNMSPLTEEIQPFPHIDLVPLIKWHNSQQINQEVSSTQRVPSDSFNREASSENVKSDSFDQNFLPYKANRNLVSEYNLQEPFQSVPMINDNTEGAVYETDINKIYKKTESLSSLFLKEISSNRNVNHSATPASSKLALSIENLQEKPEVIQPKVDKWSKKKVGINQSEEIKSIKFPQSKYFANKFLHRFDKLESRKNVSGKSAEILTNEDATKDTIRFLKGTKTKFSRSESAKKDLDFVDDTTVKFITSHKLIGMTTTGVNSPVLVLYTERLNKEAKYLLRVKTHNPLNNNTGEASQIVSFYRQPYVDLCNIKKEGTTLFGGGCDIVGGLYRPVKLMYSYRFFNSRQRTVFYYGSLPWIEFTLPSGPSADNYTVYVVVEAVDSKGCISAPNEELRVKVIPRYKTKYGTYSLFYEISVLSQSNPAIELQHIRTLAWELNILPPNVLLEIFDNILAIVFYRDECQDSIKMLSSIYAAESFGFQPARKRDDIYASFKEEFLTYIENWMGDKEIFVKFNLLKSCARDQLVIKASQIPTRDQMEVMMVLTTLTILVDAPEKISWLTFQRVVDAMIRAKNHQMWFWDLHSDIRSEVAKNYFILTSTVLQKQYEIFDCPSIPYSMVDRITDSLFDLMTKEITSRFLEEEPLTYISSYLQFTGYLAKSKNLNAWSDDLPFYFMGDIFEVPGIHTVMSLMYYQTPYLNSSVEINSFVLNLRLSWKRFIGTKIKVFLPRSLASTKNNYDFRKKGTLNYESFSVYSFDVKKSDRQKTLFISLQVTKEYTPVSAVIMICKDMQSLDNPVLQAIFDSQMMEITILVPPYQLEEENYLLVIMDKNSYDNQWAGINVESNSNSAYGVDFLLGFWWSECYVWETSFWLRGGCQPQNSSTWKSTHCLCSSDSTIYGAVGEPLLTVEDQVTVNELMLVSSFVALYFIVVLLIFYVVVFIFLYKSERGLKKRRNLWLVDNEPSHPHAYLLTINTGTQSNAGTFSSVYAILNGAKAMSPTRELQSRKGETLFTRGSVCSFILTSSVPLGDILSVQLWHDDYGEGRGWFVCEVSVTDLETGSKFIYPCYKWLSVASEDAQVVREITLEKPTTFFQDFEHLLPQFVGEYTLWYALTATSNSKKFYKLQVLTIFITICLLLGTISLNVVKRINSSHTMITPDPHIETLYNGFLIAGMLLPLQWMLRLVFKASDLLAERIFYNRIVKEMIDKRSKNKKNSAKKNEKKTSYNLDGNQDDFYDPSSELWQNLTKFAQSFGPLDVDDKIVSSGFAKIVRKQNENEVRHRTKRSQNHSNHEDSKEQQERKRNQREEGIKSKNREPQNKDGHCFVQISDDGSKNKEKTDSKKFLQDKAQFFISATISMSIGWLISLCCVGVCILLLLNQGSEMPKDYSSLWTQTVFTSICASLFIVQPFAIVFFTLYKVTMYRIFGSKGLFSFLPSVFLDQAITVWNHYREKLESERDEESDDEETKRLKELERVRRERRLRFAYPPPEHVLIEHRNQFLKSKKISSFFKSSLWNFGFFFYLLFIAHNFYPHRQFNLNKALKNSAINGSCMSKNSLVNKPFMDIVTHNDWWQWAYSEFLDLTFNYDETYTDNKLFCDSESMIIGTPRIRIYQVKPEPCESDAVRVNDNETMSDIYYIRNCYPDYKDNVDHVRGFSRDQDPQYEWDAHYLSIIYGYFSEYSYTADEKVLPNNYFDAWGYLMLLEAKEWLKIHKNDRAIVAEFTVFHPQTRYYSCIEFVAEFPSVSGAKLSLFVASSSLNRFESYWNFAFRHGDIILLAISMIFLRKTCIALYKCRFKFWNDIWTLVDLCTTILCWSYVICLMLRVHIAEDLLWQLQVTNYQQYVNIKSITTWDQIFVLVIGLLIVVQLIRSIRVFSIFPNTRKYFEVFLKGTKESVKISIIILSFIFIFGNLGYMWFGRNNEAFSAITLSCLYIIESLVFRMSFYKDISDSTSYQMVLRDVFFLLFFFLLFFMVFGIYKAIFIYTIKNTVSSKKSIDITGKDFKNYFKNKFYWVKTFFRCSQKNNPSEHDFKEHSSNLYLTEMESLIDTLKRKVNLLSNLTESKLDEENYEEPFGRSSSNDFSSNVDDVTLTSTSRSSINSLNTVQTVQMNEGGSTENDNDIIDLRAFDEILSAPSEFNPSTINLLSELVKQNEDEPNDFIDNSEHILRFLNDVAASSTGKATTLSYGKYGKSKTKMKKSKSLTSVLAENSNKKFSIEKGNSLETIQEIEKDPSEEDVYFSPVPIPFEGLEELLEKYGNENDSE